MRAFRPSEPARDHSSHLTDIKNRVVEQIKSTGLGPRAARIEWHLSDMRPRGGGRHRGKKKSDLQLKGRKSKLKICVCFLE